MPTQQQVITHRARHGSDRRASKSHWSCTVHLRLPLSRDAVCGAGRCDDRKGKDHKLDTSAAEKMPGVSAILHRGNIGKIFRSIPGPGFSGICEERRPPFEDDVVRYYGQYIALAVAETFETAKAAADAVVATYAAEQPNVELQLVADDEPDEVMTTFGPMKRLESERGDPDAAFAGAPVKLDHTYVTPFETHNPMEPHSTTAIWEGSTLTLYESSQGVVNLRGVLAQMFGLPVENVRVITKFVGSGFRQQAVAVDAVSAGRSCCATSGQAGETGARSQNDVPRRRASAAHTAARSSGRNSGRQTGFAAAGLHLHTVDARCPS